MALFAFASRNPGTGLVESEHFGDFEPVLVQIVLVWLEPGDTLSVSVPEQGEGVFGVLFEASWV